MTSSHADGPVGMVVGSFTSVSLEPPLVAYFPKRTSKTFALLGQSSTFAINVLGSSQETLCRRLSAKDETVWGSVDWHLSSQGNPIFDDAVAWIECEPVSVLDGGDHYIVLARVIELDIQRDDLPLLFFQGGYGRFAPLSIAALVEDQLSAQVELAELARPEMERLARELGVECVAQAAIGNEIVHLATILPREGTTTPGPVGLRLPLAPPLGSLHVAWAPDHVRESWLAHSGHTLTETDRVRCLALLERVRARGWSVALRIPDIEQRVSEARRSFGRRYTAALEQKLLSLLGDVLDFYDGSLEPGRTYDVRFLGAPVLDDRGQVKLAIKMFDLPPSLTADQIEHLAGRLVAACRQVSVAATQAPPHAGAPG
ncbi:flavin reductase [Dactylosporangium sp. NPDC000555]|uniref:flavin reductase n=1 Tax=Dactylosporangium sp. NPDC000555 TaxID=3154260 RepID=UPI0033281969